MRQTNLNRLALDNEVVQTRLVDDHKAVATILALKRGPVSFFMLHEGVLEPLRKKFELDNPSDGIFNLVELESRGIISLKKMEPDGVGFELPNYSLSLTEKGKIIAIELLSLKDKFPTQVHNEIERLVQKWEHDKEVEDFYRANSDESRVRIKAMLMMDMVKNCTIDTLMKMRDTTNLAWMKRMIVRKLIDDGFVEFETGTENVSFRPSEHGRRFLSALGNSPRYCQFVAALNAQARKDIYGEHQFIPESMVLRKAEAHA